MEGLKPKQVKALGLLVSGTSITNTAKDVGVDRSVIYNWFDLPTFKAAYNLQLDQMKRNTEAGLLSLSEKAIKALERCVDSDNQQISFKAALHVIEKVQHKGVGHIDPRDIIANECRYPVYDDSGYKIKDELCTEDYEAFCEDAGINPYPEFE